MEGASDGERVNAIPGLDDVEQRAWQSFLATALRVHFILNRTLMDTHHLGLIDVRLLDALERSPRGSARMGDLAEMLMALPSRVTRQIHRLERQSLVKRSSSTEDRRGVLATITDLGRMALSDAMVTYGDGVRANFLASLSHDQVVAVVESCEQIEARLHVRGMPTRGGRGKNAYAVSGGVAERPNALALKARDG